jgi:chromosome segregation ATPase
MTPEQREDLLVFWKTEAEQRLGQLTALSSELAAALTTLTTLQQEKAALEGALAQWRKSFDGHVYVTNETYSALVTRAEQAEATTRRLHEDYRIQNDAIVRLQDEARRLREALEAAGLAIAPVPPGRIVQVERALDIINAALRLAGTPEGQP